MKRWGVLVALISFACPAAVAAQPPEAIAQEAVVDAIWVGQRLEYTYESFNTYYSCSSLQAKLTSILRAVGAHEKSIVQVRCLGGRLVNHAHAQIIAIKPLEATPENVAAATTYDSRTELLARVKNVQLPTANDIERFPASWHTLSLHRRDMDLGSGDCELLRDFSNKVFPQLAIQIVGSGLRCTDGVALRMNTKLVVTALMPTQAIPVAQAGN